MYHFGPHNPRFDGSREEFTALGQTVVTPIVKKGVAHVTCPHCGSNNQHTPTNGHRTCDTLVKCKVRKTRGFYDCPGYVVNIN